MHMEISNFLSGMSKEDPRLEVPPCRRDAEPISIIGLLSTTAENYYQDAYWHRLIHSIPLFYPFLFNSIIFLLAVTARNIRFLTDLEPPKLK